MKNRIWVVITFLLGTQLALATDEKIEVGLTGVCSPEAQARGPIPKECFQLADPRLEAGAKQFLNMQIKIPKDDFKVEQTKPLVNVEIGEDPTKIVNLLKWFWQFLQDNKAVVNIPEFSFAQALPLRVRNTESLTDWQDVKTISPSRPIVFKNLLGMPVVTSHYLVQFTPGGKWNGRGQYLSNVAVVYGDHNVYPGFKMNVTSKVMAVLRYGSKDDPVAGIQLVVNHEIQALNHVSQMDSFVVKGDGTAREVTANYYRSGQ